MNVRASLVTFVLLAACAHPPTPSPARARSPSASSATPPDETAFAGGKLPTLPETDSAKELPSDAPRVTVIDAAIRANDLAVGDVPALLEKGRLELLRGALAEARRSWISSHPGTPFPAIVVFELDRGVRAPVVKRLALDAGMAGYAYACIVVVAGHRKSCLDVGIDAPTPIKPPRVRLCAPERFSVSWSPTEITSTAALIESARTELQNHGGYGIVLDPADDVDLATMVMTTNALSSLPQVSIATD